MDIFFGIALIALIGVIAWVGGILSHGCHHIVNAQGLDEKARFELLSRWGAQH